MARLMVYGTLKRGGRLHRELDGATFVGTRTLHGFTLFDTGRGYPCVVHGDGVVHGEEYEVDDALLRHLDSVEADEYARRMVDGVWVYVWAHPTTRFAPITSGVWPVRHEGRSTTRS